MAQHNGAMSDVTSIQSQIDAGDPRAAEQLLPLVYSELRKLAAAKLAHEKPGQTLQATALVHEAYPRLVDKAGDREHGAGYAAERSGVRAQMADEELVSEVRRSTFDIRSQTPDPPLPIAQSRALSPQFLRPSTHAATSSRPSPKQCDGFWSSGRGGRRRSSTVAATSGSRSS